MRRFRPVLCLLCAALLLFALLPPRMNAAETVYFTAVNEQLLPLNDETMPFWSYNTLYVSHLALDGTDLRIHTNLNREQQSVTLYRKSSAIIFDLDDGGAVDNKGTVYAGSAVLRGSTVFFPVDTICRFFNLEYSYSRVTHGYLLRIINDSAVLSDAAFIDAATSAFNQRYTQYERSQSASGEGSVAPVQQPQENTNEQRTVYLLLEVTDPRLARQLLSELAPHEAAFLFTPSAAENAGDLLRQLIAEGGAVVLRVEAGEGAAVALRQIEAGNRALWAAANLKTRLVRLDSASEDTLRAVREAGYCPIRYTLDYGASRLSVAQMSTRILSAADPGRGSCRVFLGTEQSAADTLSELLTTLHDSNCIPAQLNETVLD